MNVKHMIMKEKLTKDHVCYLQHTILKPIVKTLGIKAWLVGGCVRDIINGEGVNDIDVVCTDVNALVNALDEFCTINKISHTIHPMQNGHAVVFNANTVAMLDDNFSILPPSIQFEISQLNGPDIYTDAMSRDFICNTWYVDITGGDPVNPNLTGALEYNASGKYIYPCCGVDTFQDSPIRIFRAMDLMCRGYKPTVELLQRITEYLHAKNSVDCKVSCLQVVHKIFCRLASGEYKVDDVIYAFDIMMELGAWDKMVHPVFGSMASCIHNNQYHHDTVWQHTMEVIRGLATYDVHNEQDVSIKVSAYDYWVALLHDTGKVMTKTIDSDKETHFYGHQLASVEIAKEILKDSSLGNVWTKYVLDIIAHHMDTKQFGDEPLKYSQYKHVRKLMWELGDMTFNHFLAINHADCAASERSKNMNTLNIVRAVKDMAYHRGESAWECYKLPVTGADILQEFPEIQPAHTGFYLKQLYKVTFSRPEDYETKEQCIHYVRTLVKTGWIYKSHKVNR